MGYTSLLDHNISQGQGLSSSSFNIADGILAKVKVISSYHLILFMGYCWYLIPKVKALKSYIVIFVLT